MEKKAGAPASDSRICLYGPKEGNRKVHIPKLVIDCQSGQQEEGLTRGSDESGLVN